MKSKSGQIKSTTTENQKNGNSYDFLDIIKPFDFVGLYKTAAETNKILEKYRTDNTTLNKEITGNKLNSPKRERSLPKIKKKNKQELVGISQINIDASSLNSNRGACPKPSQSPPTAKTSVLNQGVAVKSIMKNASIVDQPTQSTSKTNNKPKKRNKSVSFMLDDSEEVVVKRTKSDDPINVNKKTENAKSHVKENKKTNKKSKKDQQSEKENTTTEVNKQNMDVDCSPSEAVETKQAKKTKTKTSSEPVSNSGSSNSESPSNEKNKKSKKNKKQKPETKTETNEPENNNNEVAQEAKTGKKHKKKKQMKNKTANKRESGDDDADEPVPKSRKKERNPDLAEDLENLSIGDNAHMLTNLLGEMSVIDKERQNKSKEKSNKNRKPKASKEEADTSEELKEKIIWKKRKWNKDRKGEISDDNLETTVIVENLPINIVLNFKKLLTDHFIKYGLIKKVGMAEVYPTDESNPTFTTTIIFNSDGAAELALQENSVVFQGNRIRVRRPLPPTETTIVVRSYAELNDQNISTRFQGFGRIRNIRHLVKGKKSMSTTFVEFDGPEAVERALNKMADSKIGGKKVHVAKFEPRSKKKKEKKPKEDSDADADSEDSID